MICTSGTAVGTHICIYSIADDIYLCIVCTATTYLKQSMDQPRKVAKPARDQLNRETKCPRKCIRGKSVMNFLHLFMGTCTFVHG